MLAAAPQKGQQHRCQDGGEAKPCWPGVTPSRAEPTRPLPRCYSCLCVCVCSGGRKVGISHLLMCLGLGLMLRSLGGLELRRHPGEHQSIAHTEPRRPRQSAVRLRALERPRGDTRPTHRPRAAPLRRLAVGLSSAVLSLHSTGTDGGAPLPEERGCSGPTPPAHPSRGELISDWPCLCVKPHLRYVSLYLLSNGQDGTFCFDCHCHKRVLTKIRGRIVRAATFGSFTTEGVVDLFEPPHLRSCLVLFPHSLPIGQTAREDSWRRGWSKAPR